MAGDSALSSDCKVIAPGFCCLQKKKRNPYPSPEERLSARETSGPWGYTACAPGRPMMLVGRDGEIVALNALFRDCTQGKGSVAVIRGPVAGGKTSLLQAVAEQAVAAGDPSWRCRLPGRAQPSAWHPGSVVPRQPAARRDRPAGRRFDGEPHAHPHAA